MHVKGPSPFKLQLKQTGFSGLKEYKIYVAYKFYRASTFAKFYCSGEMQTNTGNPFYAFISAILSHRLLVYFGNYLKRKFEFFYFNTNYNPVVAGELREGRKKNLFLKVILFFLYAKTYKASYICRQNHCA
jgi:hypothetical protein